MRLPVTIRRESRPGHFLHTGEHCTATGWWAPLNLGGPRFITEGSLMPAIDGQRVLWESRWEEACAATCPAHGSCRRGVQRH